MLAVQQICDRNEERIRNFLHMKIKDLRNQNHGSQPLRTAFD